MIPLTRIDPPKPGMVRLKRDFGTVDHRNGLDTAGIGLQIGDAHFGFHICGDSNGAGPVGDFSVADVVAMLRSLADRIEGFK